MTYPIRLFAVLLIAVLPAAAAVPAFPGAEGFGAFSKGGRGGKVLIVTNLRDYSYGEEPIAGSLRAAVQEEGPRTIIFRVSGIIELKSPITITNPYITIAGQTAPGDGICLKNHELLVRNTHDVVIRHIRMRPGEEMHDEMDSIYVMGSENVIFDHCSASWSTDEVFSMDGKNITVQWCIIAEGLDRSFHPKGKHSKGSILRGTDGGITSHHNLYAHNADRNPKTESYPNQPGLILDFRNNVVYDWGYQTGYSGEDYVRINHVANFLKPGPSSSRSTRVAFRPGSERTKIYMRGNYLEGNKEGNANNEHLIRWDAGDIAQVSVTRPYPSPLLNTQTAAEAEVVVLERAGAILPKRDAVDERIVNNVKNGTGRIIDSQNEVGGWPKYRSEPTPADKDKDGMPDAWEAAHGLIQRRKTRMRILTKTVTPTLKSI